MSASQALFMAHVWAFANKYLEGISRAKWRTKSPYGKSSNGEGDNPRGWVRAQERAAWASSIT